ncbi:MAG: hypothetical protein ABI592_02965 [Acidobacteriota bacterium]
MNRDNVVPFVSGRNALARRGAPDKARVPVSIEIECPRCATLLWVEPETFAGEPEILCSGCETSFSVVPGEAV